MKHRKKLFVSSLFLLAAILLLFIVLRNNAYQNPEYNGDRIGGADQYTLNFTAMNGEQAHTMSLKAGDTLHCTWQIEQGNVDLTISAAETKIYQGNRIDHAAFDVTIPADGDYVISVKGTHAAGSIDIYRQQ